MNESLILVVDYAKICRLCLQTTGAMSDIFENNGETSLNELVHNATGLEMDQNDGLPTRICHKCRYVVELSCELRDMVAKTHQLLSDARLQVVKDCDVVQEREIDKVQQSIDTKYEMIDIKIELKEGEVSNVKEDPSHEPDGIKWGNSKIIKEESREDNTKTILETNYLLATNKTRKKAPKHLTCQICLTPFPTTEDVNLHVDTHYIDSSLTPYLKLQRPYKCEECNRAMSKTQMIRHHRTHLDVNPYVCTHAGCGFVGKDQDSLRHHALKHGSRSQVCERCGASFRRRWELRQHAARAHRPAPAHCNLCAKQFRNTFTYQAHLQLHYREPRHVCEWAGCSKAYHSRAALDAHARSHSGDRQYKCHLCSAAAYTSQSLLNRHVRMHERARLSKCDKCAATFEDYGSFYEHRVSQHGPWQPYRCVGCNKRYQSEAKFNKHEQVCEKAIRMKAFNDSRQSDETLETPEQGATLHLGTGDLLTLKGQSLLVQPGNLSELGRDLVLQELPPDGLLYIEVDEEEEAERPQSNI